MSEIFISYAREDRETAQRLARALEAHGWSVWWDARLDAGEDWRKVINRELAAARCVIVLWSQASVDNDWVLEEAERGRQRQILVPAKIANVQPPLPFGGIQTADLINWKGQLGHPGFNQLMLSVANILEKLPTPPPPPRSKRVLTAITILLLVAIPLVLLFVSWNYPQRYFFSLAALAWQSDLTIPPAVASPVSPSLKFYGNRKNHETALTLEADALERFAMDTGIKIEIFNPDQEERLPMLEKILASRSRELDAVLIDIIWTGELAPHLMNLRPFLEEEINLHDQKFIENNTVENRLVALPWFQNIGLLFYREDLLKDSGLGVPDTWEELEEAAAKIQTKQKEKDPEFIGFAWQGARYEGLTCNALEWIASEGALDAVSGLPLFDHRGMLDALDRARTWVNGESAISPYAQHHMEQESLQTFLNGKAAFLRGWSNEYARLKQSGIEFGVAPLPVPERRKGEKSFSVLGGWQLAVPKYSLDQRSAIELIRYLSGSEVQKWRALEGAYQPTIEKVIEDIDVQEELPFLKYGWFQNIQLIIRPSNQLGNRYNQVSERIYESVDAALARNSREEIKQDIENMENCVERASNPETLDEVPSDTYNPYNYVP